MHAQAATIRKEIEAKLADRIPGALSPVARQTARLYTTGNIRLDDLLDGGLPLGSLCEVTGVDGSGRSSIALSVMASASQEGACAYIDVSDTLSPQSAAAAGVQLHNLLWVRFPVPERAISAAAATPVVRVSAESRPLQRDSVQPNRGGPHPRGETKHLAPALKQMLVAKEERRGLKKEGTPGYPNQPLGLHTPSQEQVSWERFNIRRVDASDPLRRLDRAAAESARQRALPRERHRPEANGEHRPWGRLDRALRATDQVQQSGGFRVVVLDLACIAPDQALRIPSATWWRFQKAAAGSDAILLLLTREPCARSSAACVLECSLPAEPQIQGVMAVTARSAEVARQRTAPTFGKRASGRVASWNSTPVWMRAVGR